MQKNDAALIGEGSRLKARISADSKRLKEIEGALVNLPPGTHEGENGAKCQVIAPAASIKLDSDDAETVKEAVGADAFSKLFDRVVSFKPVKSFRDILGALVGKREQNKVLRLTEKPGTAYVKWA